MIIGAQKSGTTSLAYQLSRHPRVCFCAEKEPAFFNRHPRWQDRLGEYHALYTPQPGEICGEASTMYTFLPEWLDTHVRLHAYNPELKLVYIMRDPVERILSHYAFRQVRDRVDEPADRAVLSDPSYVNRSRYALQIQPYIETFGRDRVLLLVFEEYVADPRATLREVASFLGIDPVPFETMDTSARGATTGKTTLSDRGKALSKMLGRSGLRGLVPDALVHAVKGRFAKRLERKPEITPATRAVLRRMLAGDVLEIEQLMRRRIAAWSRDA